MSSSCSLFTIECILITTPTDDAMRLLLQNQTNPVSCYRDCICPCSVFTTFIFFVAFIYYCRRSVVHMIMPSFCRVVSIVVKGCSLMIGACILHSIFLSYLFVIYFDFLCCCCIRRWILIRIRFVWRFIMQQMRSVCTSLQCVFCKETLQQQ